MGKRILIIDDSASIRQILKITLAQEGYETTESIDGQDALDKVEQNGNYNLIICDVNMPNVNGIEFVKRIKQDPKHKFTPVMMLTTESEEEKKIQGMEAGAKAWLVKPFHQSHLVEAVAKLIR